MTLKSPSSNFPKLSGSFPQLTSLQFRYDGPERNMMKNLFTFLLGAGLLLGCSTKSGSSAATLCTQASTSKQSNLTSSDPSLGLTTSASQFESASVGIGFLDITTMVSGTPRTIRCTVNIHPAFDAESKFILWTAGHCAFDPRKTEFQTAVYSVRLYQDGGYFEVPVELEYQQSAGKFIQDFETLLKIAPGVPASVLTQYTGGNWYPEDAASDCQQSTSEFKSELGSAAKDILCFTEGEMRGLTVKATTTPEIQTRVERLLSEVAARNRAIIDSLPAQWKNLFDFYYKAHVDKVRLANWIRRLGYYLNAGFCTAPLATRPQPDSIPRDFNKFCEAPYRGMILGNITNSKLPTYLKNEFTTVANQPAASPETLNALYEKYAKSQEVDIFTWNKPIEETPEDVVAQIAKKIFGYWSEFGFEQLAGLNIKNSSRFGFNEETLFTFANNKMSNPGDPLSMKPRIASLYNPNYQTEIKTKVRKLLVNFDSTVEKLELIKGDSGSMLSLFGGFPFGLLSTVNGEPTSGGASITPLPEVGGEDAAKSATPIKNGGC